MANIFAIIKGSRTPAGHLRRSSIHSRCFVAAAASPSVPQGCQRVPEIKLSAYKRQQSACERPQMIYQLQSQIFAPKSSLFSSVASPELSGIYANPDSPLEDSVIANGAEKAEPVSPKQSDSAAKNEAIKGGKHSVAANSDEKAEPITPEQSDLAAKNMAVKGRKVVTNKTARTSETYSDSDEEDELVSPKQPDSVGKNKAVKGGKAETNKTAQTKKTYSDTDSDEEDGFSTEELLRLVRQKEELLKAKNKEIGKMQDKFLRSYAEIENVMDRTRREAESSKKFAIQSFAKSMLDVADNLGRASSVVKESFSKIDASKDTSEAAPLLKTLLEGVEMTEKQLLEVFKKYGIERFDPINEHFDPHRHMAVFQVPDATKPPGTVAVLLKPGYMLHDRVIRPAEVGVVGAVQDEAGGSSGPSI